MNKLPILFLSCFLVLNGPSYADEKCSSVIALSKITTNTTSDNSNFDNEASTFCSEYSKGSSTASNTNFAASYKFMAASFGQDNASTEQIASKVCSSSNRSVAKSDAYKQYIETIAPGAFNAYDSCLKAKDNIQFDIDSASILPKEFTLATHFTLNGVGAKALLSYAPSSDVTCAWNRSNAAKAELKPGASTTLTCRRSDQSKRAYVKVINEAGFESITIPWQAYDSAGIPVDTIASFSRQIAQLQASVTSEGLRSTHLQTQVDSTKSTVDGLAKGSQFVIFKTSTCPTGWNLVANLLVGMDGTQAATISNDGINPGGGSVGAAMVGAWPGFHPSLCYRS